MRALWVLLLVGCAPHWNPTAHVGHDGTAEGARVVSVLRDGEVVRATTKGVITYRGGDRIDWLVFELPALDDCREYDARIVVTLKTPRPGLGVAMKVITATDEHRAAARKKKRRELRFTSAPGVVSVAIYAPGADDAAEYTLELEAVPADVRGCPAEIPESTDLVRPSAELPAVSPPFALRLPRAYRVPVQIERWSVERGFEAVLEIGARGGVRVGDHAIPLIDGARTNGSLQIVRVLDDRCFAVPHNIRPAQFSRIWNAVLLPRGELNLAIGEHDLVIGRVIRSQVIEAGYELTVAVGSNQGVTMQSKAAVLDASGRPMKIPLSIASVSERVTIVRFRGVNDLEPTTIGFGPP